MKKFFADFKKFITRGNVLDLAVAVIVGGAFTAIVNSFVKDLIMPLIVRVTPVQNLSELAIVLRPETSDGAGDALLWHYGNFIQTVIDFLLTAFMVFVIIRVLMRAQGFISPKYGETLTKKEYIALRKQGKTKQEIRELDAMRSLQRKAEADAAEAEAKANSTEGLLTEIRDMLRAQKDETDNKGV